MISLCPPATHRDSYGFEVSPDVEFNFPMEQTTLSFGYIYSYKYYENRLIGSSGNDDNTHDFHAGLTHAFSERYSVSVKDSFVIGQEPDFLRAGNTFTTFQRYSGNNLRNYGSIDFSAQLTPEFGLDFGYANTLLSYSDNANPGVRQASAQQQRSVGYAGQRGPPRWPLPTPAADDWGRRLPIQGNRLYRQSADWPALLTRTASL